ncbi:MAG TPA: hypothetical protein PLU35_02370 [Phycisphaerales bacterium]|nr:hypothetical protein [Phycisphaerales bacterium]
MADPIKAHFDGRVFVPDEPVNLRPGQRVQVRPEHTVHPNGDQTPSPDVIADRIRNIREYAGSVAAPVLPDEALRRESMYEERT